MKGQFRGVVVIHTDFQGNTPQAVKNSRDFAETITQALRAQFEQECRDAQSAGKLQKALNLQDLYAQFEKNYKIRVVKVDL